MIATGTKGLLVWCKQITRNYGEDVEVKNMTTSFKNGMAFCAIIHHYRPDLIDFAKLSKENVAENNELAFRIAEDELDIPALLDVEDMVVMRVPDKLSIMTYVSQYYNYFKDKIPGEIEVKKYASKKRQHAKDKIPASPAKKTNEALTSKTILNKSAVPQQQQQQQQSRSSTCCSCGKQVFLMERLTVESKLFHRVCFKCSVCQVQLKTSTYEYDSRLGLFYCTRDYKERGKIRQQPIGKESSPRAPEHAQKNQDTLMPDASQVPLSIGDTPFKRNEQFFRRGIKPESMRTAEMGAEDKPNVIKSKAEEHNKRISPHKDKSPGKFSFAKLVKKKSKEPVTEKTSSDYSNPSYQKHLELSNYMNKLDSRSNEHRVVIGAEAGSDYTEQPTSPVHKFAGAVQPDVTSTEPAGKSKKKKLKLKIKKKKGKDKDSVDGVVEETEQISAVKKHSADYENIDRFASPQHSSVHCDDNDKLDNQDNNLNDSKQRASSIDSIDGKRLTRAVSLTINDITDPPDSSYVMARSNLKKVSGGQNTETASLGSRDSRTDSIGDSYLDVRSRLKKSTVSLEKTLRRDSQERIDQSLSPEQETYIDTKKSLQRTISVTSENLEDINKTSDVTRPIIHGTNESVDSSSGATNIASLKASNEKIEPLESDEDNKGDDPKDLAPETQSWGSPAGVTIPDPSSQQRQLNDDTVTEEANEQSEEDLTPPEEPMDMESDAENNRPFSFITHNENESGCEKGKPDIQQDNRDIGSTGETDIVMSPEKQNDVKSYVSITSEHTSEIVSPNSKSGLDPDAIMVTEATEKEDYNSQVAEEDSMFTSDKHVVTDGEGSTKHPDKVEVVLPLSENTNLQQTISAIQVIEGPFMDTTEDARMSDGDTEKNLSDVTKQHSESPALGAETFTDPHSEALALDDIITTDQFSETPALDGETSADLHSETPALDDEVLADLHSETSALDDETSADLHSETPALDDEVSADLHSETPALDDETSADLHSKIPGLDHEVSADLHSKTPALDDTRSEIQALEDITSLNKHTETTTSTDEISTDIDQPAKLPSSIDPGSSAVGAIESQEESHVISRSNQKKSARKNLNPFDDSSEDDDDKSLEVQESKKIDRSNPFLTSTEDLLFDDEEEENDSDDMFDDSNPFADDARLERRNTGLKGSLAVPFQRNGNLRLSQKDRDHLKKIGVDESNPFAEDCLDESDEENVADSSSSSVLSQPPRPNNRKKKLVLKTKQGLKVSKAPPPPTSPHNTVANDHTVAQNKPKPKKRVAPKAPGGHSPASSISATPPPPVSPSSPSLSSSSSHSPARSKKRAAPKPPQMESKGTPTEMFVPTKPPRRGASAENDQIDTNIYANLKFPTEETTDLKTKVLVETEDHSIENVDQSIENVDPSVQINTEEDVSSQGKSDENIPSSPQPSADHDDVIEDSSVVTNDENDALSNNDMEGVTEAHDSEEDEDSVISTTSNTEEEITDTNQVERDSNEETLPHMNQVNHHAETVQGIELVDNDTKEVVAHTEKRKAPPRPKPPTVSLNDAQVSQNIALRDKQPKREEIECELRFLEEKQRELEQEGVAMEKKLRDCTEGEPEDAYLLTWFELVNQKNQLLRRENELIYMCQELDFLQNQRHAEFELRQLMMKNEDEKTDADNEREEELLAHILELVTMRSNIVDKMDEERIREYEEDEEVRSMMESQGLTSTAGTEQSKSEDKVKEGKTKKKKEKKEKKKKK